VSSQANGIGTKLGAFNIALHGERGISRQCSNRPEHNRPYSIVGDGSATRR